LGKGVTFRARFVPSAKRKPFNRLTAKPRRFNLHAEESRMLHVPDHLFGRGPSRREWLQLGGLGLFGLTLPALLSAQATANKTKSVVLFILHGGPSQLDIWDMKPAAPPEIRGEFKPMPTSVPGIQITEHLPRLAKLAGRFTIVRSMTHTSLF